MFSFHDTIQQFLETNNFCVNFKRRLYAKKEQRQEKKIKLSLFTAKPRTIN